MSRIFKSVEELIGHTPLIELTHMEKETKARILVKAEAFNPGGSAKDRAALWMLRDARERGVLKDGATVIEPTSGNTGIGLAMAAAVEGYTAVIVMPDSMTPERRKLMQAYGAKVVLTPGAEGMDGAVKKAEELAAKTENSFIPAQFDNPANALSHYESTGPELYADADGHIDAFVAGVGTGGTLTGIGRYLKEQNPAIGVIAVEPASSPVLSGGKPGPHGIQGIGGGFIPAVLDTTVYDEVFPVTDEQAFDTARRLGREEGILTGISGGAALFAALAVACREEYNGKTVAVLLPDTGERYLSTTLFGEG